MKIITQAKVFKKNYLSNDVIELMVKPELKINYNPASFVQLTLERVTASEIWPESRTFSIASYNDFFLRFIIENKGNYTNKIIQSVEVDDVVTIKYPFGNMFSNKNLDFKQVFIAGGLGITPFLGLIDYLESISQLDNIDLFYSAKSKEKLFYLDRLNAKIKNLYLFTTQNPSNHYNRRIKIEDILSKKYNKNTHFYICGNKEFIQYFKTQLLSHKHCNIHLDEWE